jgi:hypothetical protein
MNFIKKIPFHPLIFAPYPLLTFAASNLGWASELQFIWTLAASLLLMLITFILTWLMTRNFRKAAAITTLFLLLFFTYGHVYGLVAKNSDPTIWLTILWLLIFIGGIWWILSRPKLLQDVTHALNWISLILLLFPLVTLGVGYIQDLNEQSEAKNTALEPILESILPEEPPSDLPDIYFVILDGYARADTLDEIYDYDNQPLMDFLRDRGFFIAEESSANYHHTVLSLSTTLNMTYIKDLLVEEGITSYDYWRIVDHIKDNRVFQLASDAGYQLVAFDSGYSITAIRHVDHFMMPKVTIPSDTDAEDFPEIQLGFYETRFLETTALRSLLPIILEQFAEDSRYERHRQHILYTFSNLASFAREEGSYFIFAHILAPHPPFVFDANGEPVRNWRPYTVSDGSHWVGGIGTRPEYIAGYRDQLIYINALLMKTIDEILTQSETPPVIIIQGDHGPGAYFEWQSFKQTNLNERMTILNAIYFPGGDQDWLYPSITPVNTFPIVFNRYLGQDFKLLEDRAYFSKWGQPFEFVEVTDLIQQSLSP